MSSPTTFAVKVGSIQRRPGKGPRVRWYVDGKEKGKTFGSVRQADSFRSELLAAVNRGESFDVSRGLPLSLISAEGLTCYQLAKEMVAAKWPDAAAHSRRTEVDNLSYLLCALVPDRLAAADPRILRLALRSALRPVPGQLAPAQVDALRWLERVSLPVSEVTDDVVRRVLQVTSKKADGSLRADSGRVQRRTYLSGLMAYAVEQKLLKTNPVAAVAIKKQDRAAAIRPVNARQIGSKEMANELLAAMTDPVCRGYASTAFLAGMRPEEVSGLRIEDCSLPAEGWGLLLLATAAPAVGGAWTDSGKARDNRRLKHRSRGELRPVPIPPRLVEILRDIIGQRTSGWVFVADGAQLGDWEIGQAWQDARAVVGVNADVLPRIYDLRHLHASMLLNANVSAVEVSARLGHSVAVLLATYAHVIETERPKWNAVIEGALE